MQVFKRWYNRRLRDRSVVNTIKEAIRMYEDGLNSYSVQLLKYAIELIEKKTERENYAD